jgi:hypothetical protein
VLRDGAIPYLDRQYMKWNKGGTAFVEGKQERAPGTISVPVVWFGLRCGEPVTSSVHTTPRTKGTYWLPQVPARPVLLCKYFYVDSRAGVI